MKLSVSLLLLALSPFATQGHQHLRSGDAEDAGGNYHSHHGHQDGDMSNYHKYHGYNQGSKENSGKKCPCALEDRPDLSEKALTARWMVHSLDWGTLTTISSRLGGDGNPIPFGNTYSFVDGPCDKSTGVPYFYGTFMDQSFSDSKVYQTVSFSLTDASLSSVRAHREGMEECSLSVDHGDPESPTCARVTLTGKLVPLEEDSDEYKMAQDALFQRHKSMASWPKGHNFIVSKLDIEDIWLINFYGGATSVDPKEYFAASFGKENGAEVKEEAKVEDAAAAVEVGSMTVGRFEVERQP